MIGDPAPVIRTHRLRIRETHPRDAAAIAAFLQVNRSFHQPWEPMRPEEYFTTRYQRRLLRSRRDDDTLRQFALLDGTGELLGVVVYSMIARGAFSSCVVGYRLAATAQGHGYMREGLAATTHHLFTVEGLHRVEANVMPRNERSRALLAALGFAREGLSRRFLRIQGRWEDHERWALLADDEAAIRLPGYAQGAASVPNDSGPPVR